METMISIVRRTLFTGLAAMAISGLGTATSATVVTLGNATPGFNDGDQPALLTEIIPAQTGQPAPFDAAIGNEVLGPDASASWIFNFAPVADTILSASITIGIFDHDSMASGDQLASFMVEGEDLTTGLNGLFEGSGGSDGEYNVYTLALPGSAFASLADGMVAASLALQGPGLATSFFAPFGVSETEFNGAFLIFSSLTIETDSAAVIPLPAALPLFGTGLGILGFLGWRRRRQAAAIL